MRYASIVHVTLLCSIASSTGRAAFINGYEYTQTNEGDIHYSSPGEVISTTANVDHTVTIASSGTTITFEANSQPISSSADLHTFARLSYTNNSVGTTESWDRIQATVFSQASVVDTAAVMNLPAGVSSGTLLFSWTLSGTSSYTATAPSANTVGVDTLRADVKLESTIPGFPLIYDDALIAPSFPPLSEKTIDDLVSSATGALVFPVEWNSENPDPIPVEFHLRSSVQLDARALDASEFSATAISDHFNSAILNGVMILDGDGNQLPDASLQSSNGISYPTLTSVPEPSCLLYGAISIVCVLGIRYVKRLRHVKQSE